MLLVEDPAEAALALRQGALGLLALGGIPEHSAEQRLAGGLHIDPRDRELEVTPGASERDCMPAPLSDGTP